MSEVRQFAAGLTALVAMTTGWGAAVGAATTAVVTADPAGTRIMNANPTDRAWIRILGASTAGLLYETTNSDYGNSSTWVKPAGAAPFRLDGYDALAGSLLFDRSDSGTTITYRTIGSAVTHSCPVTTFDGLAFLPSGWLAHVRSTNDYVIVSAAESGCTSRTVTQIANSRLITADPSGFAVEVTTNVANGGVHELKYVPFTDPAHPQLADTGDYVYNYVSLSNGILAWAQELSDWAPYRSAVHRWSASAGADPVVTVDQRVDATAVIGSATAFHGCVYSTFDVVCSASTVPAGGGTLSSLTDATDLAADRNTFYFARFGSTPGIDAGTVADPAELTRVVTPPKMLPGTWRVSLGASRAAYADTDGTDREPLHLASELHWRYAAKSGGTIALGPSYSGGKYVNALDVDGRRQLVGLDGTLEGGSLWLRTEGGTPVRIFNTTSRVAAFQGGPVMLSGTRALWIRSDYTGDACGGGCPQYGNRSAMLYNVRTGVSTRLGEANTTKWALWGSYLAWATKDGSIYRKDLSSGKVLTVKYKGYGVVGLGVWGSYVGWSECVERCYKGNVAYRNMSAGTGWRGSRRTRRTPIRRSTSATRSGRRRSPRTATGTATPGRRSSRSARHCRPARW